MDEPRGQAGPGEAGVESVSERRDGAEPEDRIVNKFIDGTTDLGECPLDQGSVWGADDATAFDGFGSSYVYWNRTSTEVAAEKKIGKDGVWAIEGHRAVEIASPSKKLIVADLMALSPGTFGVHKVTGPYADRHRCHNDKDPMNVSVAFADGHARIIKRKTCVDNPGDGVGMSRNPINCADGCTDEHLRQMQVRLRGYTAYY